LEIILLIIGLLKFKVLVSINLKYLISYDKQKFGKIIKQFKERLSLSYDNSAFFV